MFSCVLHTQKLKLAAYKHMRCAQCRIHNGYILHMIYICYLAAHLRHVYSIHTAYICIYISYLAVHLRHVYSIYTAYVHTCTCYTCMLHACCTHNTSILHAYCIYKNWLSATRMPYKHMKKCMQFVCNCLHAACMLYINNCMYAAHNNYMYSDVCDLMCMYVACVWR